MPPLGRLEYLYVGTSDFEADLAFYRDVVGAEVVWNFEAFGARVAAFRVSEGPLFLVADHRPAPSCLPVFGVPDIDAAEVELRARGWEPEGERFGIPDGPCYLFKDRSGNQLALFGNERPHALERA
jgi:catechol 2,3-dioxygenase-like lactoylglutathione lyase family enzyme